MQISQRLNMQMGNGRKVQRAPISRASTTSPFSAIQSFAGKQSNPFARLRLVTFELLWPPVLLAWSNPSGPGARQTLWYSGLFGSQRTSWSSCTFTLGMPCAFCLPLEYCSDGRTKRCDVTSADAGLPGKLKTSFVAGSPLLSLRGTVAKVVGFPGFMFTRPK